MSISCTLWCVFQHYIHNVKITALLIINQSLKCRWTHWNTWMNFQGLTVDVIYSFSTCRTNICKKKADLYSDRPTDGRYVLARTPCRFFKENLQTPYKKGWFTETISFFVKTPQAYNLSFIRSEGLKAKCSKVTVIRYVSLLSFMVCYASPEFPRGSFSPIICRFHKILQIDATFGHVNPVHTLLFHSLNIQFNIVLPFKFKSAKGLFSSKEF
jgi:hypothetical protein